MQILPAAAPAYPTRKSADSERVRPAVSNIKTLKSFIYTNKKSVPVEQEEVEEEEGGGSDPAGAQCSPPRKHPDLKTVTC